MIFIDVFQTFLKMGVHSSKYLVSIWVWTCLDPQIFPEKSSRGSKNLLTRDLEDFGASMLVSSSQLLPMTQHFRLTWDLGTIRNWTKSVDDYLFGGSLGP